MEPMCTQEEPLLGTEPHSLNHVGSQSLTSASLHDAGLEKHFVGLFLGVGI